jgi:hypothetical protein
MECVKKNSIAGEEGGHRRICSIHRDPLSVLGG